MEETTWYGQVAGGLFIVALVYAFVAGYFHVRRSDKSVSYWGTVKRISRAAYNKISSIG